MRIKKYFCIAFFSFISLYAYAEDISPSGTSASARLLNIADGLESLSDSQDARISELKEHIEKLRPPLADLDELRKNLEHIRQLGESTRREYEKSLARSKLWKTVCMIGIPAALAAGLTAGLLIK